VEFLSCGIRRLFLWDRFADLLWRIQPGEAYLTGVDPVKRKVRGENTKMDLTDVFK
jgi:hypothetical protein